MRTTDSRQSNYLPCSLCGRPAYVSNPVDGGDHFHYQVGCNDCGVEVCRLSEAEAISVWNSLMAPSLDEAVQDVHQHDLLKKVAVTAWKWAREDALDRESYHPEIPDDIADQIVQNILTEAREGKANGLPTTSR